METVKRTFRIKLIIRKCDQVFKEELGPGVLGTIDVTYDMPEKEFESPMFIKELLDRRTEFLDDLVYTEVQEVKKD